MTMLDDYRGLRARF